MCPGLRTLLNKDRKGEAELVAVEGPSGFADNGSVEAAIRQPKTATIERLAKSTDLHDS